MGEKGTGDVDPLQPAGVVANADGTQQVTAALLALSKQLELPDGFLMNLLIEESDWAFIVKAQAILETAVTTLLVAHLGKPELQDVIAENLENVAANQDAECAEPVQPGPTGDDVEARQTP